jgi:hypothetical protein
MNKKLKLYLLIFINAMAWGYVGFKIYNVLRGEDEAPFETTNYILKPVSEIEKKEEQNLSLDYEDPFLKNFLSRNTTSKHLNEPSNYSQKQVNHLSTIAKSTVAKTNSVSAAVTLSITYSGLVKNSSNGTETAFLNINGKSVLVKKNDIVEGYLIKMIDNNSINLIKGKEKLVINK